MDKNERTIPQLSVDTQLIYDRLCKANPGEVLTYTELSSLIDRDVQGVGRGVLNSARNMALRQNRFVFECIRNEGIKRLDDSAIVESGTDTIQRIRRAARKGALKLSSVKDFNGMNNGEKIRHNALISTLGVISHFSREVNIKRIETKVEEAQDKIPLQRTLDIFKKES
jgi:hypothetical protein